MCPPEYPDVTAVISSTSANTAANTPADLDYSTVASRRISGSTSLTEVEFLNTLLEGASFVGANLSRSMLQYAILHDAKLEGALLVGTDFTDARYLRPEMVNNAFGTFDTILPSGMTRHSHWGDECSAIKSWNVYRAKRGIPKHS